MAAGSRQQNELRERGFWGGNLAGYTDWRLPTIKELYSLILFSGMDPSGYQGDDTSNLVPFIDTDNFYFEYGDTSAGERIIDAQYWSSTEYVSTTMDGTPTTFGVNFADGRIKGYPQSGSQFVLYVRGAASYGNNDLVDNGDGTVTDLGTGLMWLTTDSGSFSVGDNSDGALTWEQALAWAEGLEYAGQTDWRLPDAKELQTLVDYTRSPDTTSSAAIDPLFTTTTITNEAGITDYPFYWTGSSHVNEQGMANFAVYIAFGRASGWMQDPAGNYQFQDVHGAGAQRSDPKSGDPADYPYGHGPQGDVVRIYNYARCVRNYDPGFSHSTTVMVTNDVPVIVERAMYWSRGSATWVDGHDSTGVTGTAATWYLAEGCTKGSFSTWVLVQNPNAAAATVEITFMDEEGNTEVVNDTIAATSRSSYNVGSYLEDKDVSTKVTSDIGVIVERAMYWDAGGVEWAGGHDSVGVTGTATTWYLAEGCTKGSFATWVLVQNPNTTAAAVEITFMDEDGNTVVVNDTINATSRSSYNVGSYFTDRDVSTKVTSGIGVIAERAIYWDAGGSNWAGGHASVGVTSTNTTWYLAEGSTNGSFATWVLVQNPNTTAAAVEITFMDENGNTEIVNDVIAATSRSTYNVVDYLADNNVSTKVVSDTGVIAERAMYWDAGGIAWAGGHCSRGVTAPAATWYLAEGCTNGFDEWVLIQNPNNTAAVCTVTFMKTDGTTVSENVTVNAASRYTINVNNVSGL